MKDLLFWLGFITFAYVFYKIMVKEPILPWKEKKHTSIKPKATSKNKKKKTTTTIDEAESFQDFFSDIKEISHHMIRHHDDSFTMFAEVTPSNYFLKSPLEQDSLDHAYETWLATFPEEEIGIYIQNRFVDLTEPIREMEKNAKNSKDLHPNTVAFGENLIRELNGWQNEMPRYEQYRYLTFHYKVNVSELKVDEDEDLNSRTIDKAFSELNRRYLSAKSSLRKSGADVQLLSSEGILEIMYHAFNRRKALKNRFEDINEQEQLALYVTAEQDHNRVESVKEMANNEMAKYSEESEEKAG